MITGEQEQKNFRKCDYCGKPMEGNWNKRFCCSKCRMDWHTKRKIIVMMRAAYKAGFDQSSEGYNGETMRDDHPISHASEEYFNTEMEKAIDRLLKEESQTRKAQ